MLGLAEMDGNPDAVEAVELLTHPDGPHFSSTVEIMMRKAVGDDERRGRPSIESRTWRVLATAGNPDPHLAALEAIWGMRDAVAPEARSQYDAAVQERIDQAAVRSRDTPR